jgi:hypothetical protein
MNAQQTKQRLFEISEYSEKVRESLKKLEASQQPGEQSGKGNKTVVLEATKTEIQELVKKGYTTKQIADALSNDVFGILPKTITQLIGAKAANKKPKTRHTPAPPAASQPPVTQGAQQRKKPVTEITDVE